LAKIKTIAINTGVDGGNEKNVRYV
jgi:hypothetical protein